MTRRQRIRGATIATWGMAALAVLAHAPVDRPAAGQGGTDPGYRSPYRVAFTIPAAELTRDLDGTERGDPRREGEVAHAHWYTRRTRERWRGWGPPARSYPPPEGLAGWSLDARRQRAIAVALRYLGYGYQHHHIPDWDPPPDWPWKPTCAGRNGKGVDCSNFTGFVCNQGFGLRLSTDVARQAEQRAATGPGAGAATPIRPIPLPGPYDERLRVLRTGDLVFIRNRRGEIGHVVLWVGAIGRAPGATPLIIDSHGEGVRDDAGRTIPCGVQLRPFREASWYNRSASHALRILDGPEGS